MQIFEVTPEDIERLGDADLRTLVGYVAEQELLRRGHSPVAVTYGGHQNAADGGIDVRVDLDDDTIDGYVPRPKTGFQVKAEDMAKADILVEMKPKGVLRPSIVELGKAGGAYVIASSKGTVSSTGLTNRRNAMSAAVSGVDGAENVHVDFYDRRRLATAVNQHPGLVPWVKSRSGKPLAGWQPFGDWSSSPGQLGDEYFLDASVRVVGMRLKDTNGLGATDGINRVRQILRQPKGVVRLVGLSGVGKTRFVQALFDERVGLDALSHGTVVYTDLADQPDPIPLELVARLQHLGQQCALIIDNCGVELHRKLSAKVRASKAPVSLISIEYDISDDEPEGTDVFKLEPASPEVLEKILKLKHPGLSEPEIRTIASFSEGNSRVALALADTAQAGESLANLKDSELFRRLFRQKNEDNPALLRTAKVCSLVYSFDGETLDGDDAELPILASLAGQSVDEFYAHIAELQRRQLIQRRSKWRAFLPHALAHRLAKEALQDIPQAAIQQHFTQMANERLVRSFSRRLGCLHDSEEAQRIVADWLRPGGWLAETENLNHLGQTVFDNIAPVNPAAILKVIKSAVERSAEGNDGGTTRWGSLLRSIAYEPELFDEAVELLAEIASGSEESNQVSAAINVFPSLFHLYLSGTHAPARQRAALLLKLARSNSDSARSLVLKGLEAMLECSHFTSGYSFEFGTRKRDYGLHPRSHADVSEWFVAVLELCGEMDKITAIRPSVRELVARELRSLAGHLDMADELVALAQSFAGDGGWSEGWVGAQAAARALRKAERASDAEKFKQLAAALKPDTIADQIKSYVLPEQWSPLDHADLEFDDPNRYKKAMAATEAVCTEIGTQLGTKPALLAQHLPALLGTKSQRVWTVFSAVGASTTTPEATWKVIVQAFLEAPAATRTSALIAGFIHGLAKHNREAVEGLLDETLRSEDLHEFLLHLQVAAAIDARAVERLVAAAALPTVPTWTFANLVAGRSCDELTGAQMKPLLLAISARDDGMSVAVDIMGMRLFSLRGDDLPLDADDKALGRELLSKLRFGKRRNSEADSIARIARSCLSPTEDVAVAEAICTRLLEGINDYSLNAWDYRELVAAMAEMFPRTVLHILIERNHTQFDGRREVFRNLRENQPCPLDAIDEEILIEWAHEREERFEHLADAVRAWSIAGSTTDEDEAGATEWTPIALRLVNEAPDPARVLAAFVDRFSPSGWSGSLAAILESRLSLFDMLLSHEQPAVRSWAETAKPSFEKKIAQAREWEAAESRERDERFEW